MSDDVTLGCNTPVNFTTNGNPDGGNSYAVSKQPSFVIVPFHDGDREDYKRKIKEQEEQKHEEKFVDKVTK